MEGVGVKRYWAALSSKWWWSPDLTHRRNHQQRLRAIVQDRGASRRCAPRASCMAHRPPKQRPRTGRSQPSVERMDEHAAPAAGANPDHLRNASLGARWRLPVRSICYRHRREGLRGAVPGPQPKYAQHLKAQGPPFCAGARLCWGPVVLGPGTEVQNGPATKVARLSCASRPSL
jgi:hypothetical protein